MSNKTTSGRRIINIISIVLMIAVTIGLVFYGSLPESYNYKVGSVAESDIYAPRTFVDTYETERQAVIAKGLVPAVFIRSDNIADTNIDNVNAFFDLVDQERSISSTMDLTDEAAASELSVNVSQSLGATIAPEDLIVFFSMTHSSFRYIRDKAVTMAELIMIEDVNEGILTSAIEEQIDAFKVASPSYSTYADAIGIVLSKIMQPNSVFDEEATEDAANNAYLAVINDPVTVSKGSKIVSSGEVITEHSYSNLSDLELIRSGAFNFVLLLRVAAYILTIAFGLVVYHRSVGGNLTSNPRVYFMMLISFIVPVAASIYLSELSGRFCIFLFFTAIASTYLGTFTGFVLSISQLLVVWPMYSFDIEVLFINIIGITVCAAIAGRRDKVSSSATLILIPTLTCLMSAMAYGFFTGHTRDEFINSGIFAIISSVSSLVAAVGIMPIYELVSNTASPVKLIALSQPGQHLLKRLFLEASGTYSHSMMVANLADSAAEAIGADALLCKVASYYHDIGKLENPQFFTENQHDGKNPHDNLPIMQSVKIITAHPGIGVRLGKKEHLPQAIINIIDEHHGTTYPGYFYNKACMEAKAKGLEEPLVDNFRYPGHIPSSRESAIVMLADTTEAAVKSTGVSDPDSAEKLIRKLVKAKIEQDQLINSGLSFDDLEKVILAFKQVYAGLFHERIKYPDANKNSKS
ncbi:MAG: HDIG domain-containing protein [Saccharofermentans sp.]|nr:HDIG domain-containing protein [Saccharofermentans sp.]